MIAQEHSCAWCAYMYGGNGNFCDMRGRSYADATVIRANNCPSFRFDREHAEFSNARFLAGSDAQQVLPLDFGDMQTPCKRSAFALASM